MKTYYVRTKDIPSLQDALGRLIEYAKFLEEDTGRSNPSFVDQIINEDNIELEIDEYDVEKE